MNKIVSKKQQNNRPKMAIFKPKKIDFNKMILYIDGLRFKVDNFILMVYIFLKAKFIRKNNTYTYMECYTRLSK